MRHALPLLVTCLLMLSACGQKGPLTLPVDRTVQEEPADETSATPETDTQDQDDFEEH